MELYGRDVPIDQRRLVGFGRDISLVSEEEYLTLAPPSQLLSFPADLTNPDLEYSGLYEDGWVSEAAFFRLTQPAAPSQIVVRGMIPQITDPAFSCEVHVFVDEHEVPRKTLGLGDFEIRAPVSSNMSTRRIDLHFSRFQQLPSPDNRPVTALLQFVGFE